MSPLTSSDNEIRGKTFLKMSLFSVFFHMLSTWERTVSCKNPKLWKTFSQIFFNTSFYFQKHSQAPVRRKKPGTRIKFRKHYKFIHATYTQESGQIMVEANLDQSTDFKGGLFQWVQGLKTDDAFDFALRLTLVLS